MTSWGLRVLIALDALIQITWRGGNPGITMSSRIGTAAAHGHAWGRYGFWLLDHTPWLGFGRDPVTGQSHCIGAMRNDVLRARQAEHELLGDPVVVSFGKMEDLKR
ncbi:MAG: hypothetical protein ACRD9W_09755 [Terriglobia bacterium]